MTKLALRKKIDLSGIAEDWNEENYIILNTFTIEDIEMFDKVSSLKTAKSQLDMMMKVLKKLFVSGVGRDENNNNIKLELEHLPNLLVVPEVMKRISDGLGSQRLKE